MRRSLLLALTCLAAAPASAAARDATVTSFDGTRLVVHLLPAPGAGRHPTVLSGHGWAGSGSTDPEAQTSMPRTGALLRAGYNVVTWDARGFGNSGGTVTVDAPDREGRDVQAILSWLARQPEARLDRPGDPRVGMVGGSYGGGIQLVTAGLPDEHRLDVIVPEIAWHSLLTSLYPNTTLKAGWASLLTGTGIPASKGRLDPHITQAFAEGTGTGELSTESRAWFAARGPSGSVRRIRVPTLLLQGTVDTLFPVDEAIENYRILRGNGVPVKMIWHCGGHGTCTTPGGNGASPVEARALAWLRRYLDRDASVRTGPAFEWVADDGTWRSGPDYPLASAGALTGQGSGTLLLAPGAGAGSAVAAGLDASGFSVAISPPTRTAQVVGAPALTIRYRATGAGTVPRLYAQIADLGHGVVLGNQVTPVPLVLDGAEHTVRVRLETLAAAATPASRYALQLVSASQVFAGQSRTTANVTLSDVRIALPTVDASRAARRTTVRARLIRRGPHRLRARVRVLHGPARKLHIAVRAGGRVVATGRAATVRSRRTLALRVKRTITRRRYRVTLRWSDPTGRHEVARRVRTR